MLLTIDRVKADFDGFDFEICREARRFLAEGPRHNGEAAVVQLILPGNRNERKQQDNAADRRHFSGHRIDNHLSVQDGISKYLAQNYDVISVVMFRYWAFAVFVFALSARQNDGFKNTFRTPQLPVQFFRGVLLVMQVCLIIWCFANIGLINTHVMFASFPLIVSALSMPLLGEKVGWQRWLAIICGFIGVIIILRPGSSVFALQSLLPFSAATAFACYHILTRYVSRRDDPMTSYFWTGIGGVIAISCIGPFFWDPMENTTDWLWMGALCILGASGHYCTIRALALAEARPATVFLSAAGLCLTDRLRDL